MLVGPLLALLELLLLELLPPPFELPGARGDDTGGMPFFSSPFDPAGDADSDDEGAPEALFDSPALLSELCEKIERAPPAPPAAADDDELPMPPPPPPPLPGCKLLSPACLAGVPSTLPPRCECSRLLIRCRSCR